MYSGRNEKFIGWIYASLDLEHTNSHIYTEYKESAGSERNYIKSCIKEMKQCKSLNKHLTNLKVDKDSEENKMLERKNGWDVTIW